MTIERFEDQLAAAKGNIRHVNMWSDDNRRQEATTSDDSDYSLSIEEALARYEAAGVPRTPRSIQG
jgi:hypothetical protein